VENVDIGGDLIREAEELEEDIIQGVEAFREVARGKIVGIGHHPGGINLLSIREIEAAPGLEKDLKDQEIQEAEDMSRIEEDQDVEEGNNAMRKDDQYNIHIF